MVIYVEADCGQKPVDSPYLSKNHSFLSLYIWTQNIVFSLGIFHPEAIKLIQTLSRYKSVRLDLDEKKTFNQEMKLLSCQLQRGNSLMFTNKSVDFADNQMDNNNNHDLSVID